MNPRHWLVVVAALLGAACQQQHVFNSPRPLACRTVSIPETIDIDRAADILFVIDNSGSMSEEQTNLAKNSSSLCADASSCTNACGTEQAVAELKQFMTAGEGRGVLPHEWVTKSADGERMKDIFDDCGFIERLQLFDNDFQIGIITTDLSDADLANRDSAGVPRCTTDTAIPPSRGTGAAALSTAQRGCLQPVVVGGAMTSGRIIRAGDGSIAEISRRFRESVQNVGACGSGFERGLDALVAFLTAGSNRAQAECNEHLTRFVRGPSCRKHDDGACIIGTDGQPVMGPAPKLVVIVVSDEEDCSHYPVTDDGPPGIDESTGQTINCYRNPETLKPVADFVQFMRNVKGDPSLVSVATIVGGRVDPSSGTFIAENCRCNGSALNAQPVPATECAPAFGNSIVESMCGAPELNAFCGSLPSGIAQGSTLRCCTADVGARYAQFAAGMSRYLQNSICEQSYKDTMIQVADLINDVGSVALGEAPADPRQLVVEMKSVDGEFAPVPPFTSALAGSMPRDDARFLSCTGCPCTGDGCSAAMPCSGFSLVDNCTTVKFHGEWLPGPGAEIRVSFLGSPRSGAPACPQ